MYETLHCIALRTIKYDDRRSIVTVWSVERGRIALLVPSGASREARRRRAIMMPLGLFEGQADIRPGRDLISIRDVNPITVLSDLACDPAKTVVAMFLSEVLEKVLRDTPADPLISEYIFDAVRVLDNLTRPVGVANFTLVFLYKLGLFLGIAPDCGSWTPGSVFDMSGGRWRTSAPTVGRWLDSAEARTAHIISRLDFSTASRFPMPRTLRRIALDRLIEYYTLHYTPLTDLRSLSVVGDIF